MAFLKKVLLQIWTILELIFHTYFQSNFMSQSSDQNFVHNSTHKNSANFYKDFRLHLEQNHITVFDQNVK